MGRLRHTVVGALNQLKALVVSGTAGRKSPLVSVSRGEAPDPEGERAGIGHLAHFLHPLRQDFSRVGVATLPGEVAKVGSFHADRCEITSLGEPIFWLLANPVDRWLLGGHDLTGLRPSRRGMFVAAGLVA